MIQFFNNGCVEQPVHKIYEYLTIMSHELRSKAVDFIIPMDLIKYNGKQWFPYIW